MKLPHEAVYAFRPARVCILEDGREGFTRTSFGSLILAQKCKEREALAKIPMEFPRVRFVFSYLASLEPGATRSGRSVTPRTGPAAKTITFREDERERKREREGDGENDRGLPTGPA